MDQNQDFSALHNLLALKRLDVPLNTEVDRFLIELHRRQRAQLLVPESAWTRSVAWIKECLSGFDLLPSLSYAAAAAAIAITAFAGLSQQVQITPKGGYKLSLHMPATESSFAMISSSLGSSPIAASKSTEMSFAPSRVNATTRFVLSKPSLAYDANAF